MNDVEPTAADRACAAEIKLHHDFTEPHCADIACLSIIIARHTAEREAGLRAEIERLRRFVDAVVMLTESESVSNQAKALHTLALVKAWRKASTENTP